VDHQSGVVLGPEHGVEGWKNVPLSKILNHETGLPVFVGNDANLMTIAEQNTVQPKDSEMLFLLHSEPGWGRYNN